MKYIYMLLVESIVIYCWYASVWVELTNKEQNTFQVKNRIFN